LSQSSYTDNMISELIQCQYTAPVLSATKQNKHISNNLCVYISYPSYFQCLIKVHIFVKCLMFNFVTCNYNFKFQYHIFIIWASSPPGSLLYFGEHFQNRFLINTVYVVISLKLTCAQLKILWIELVLNPEVPTPH
jgi:hypothetical protein